ncbi:hypothetical protein HAX54_025038 [Datura stramonium]|uniref:Uncharacterized protein n=1 Tax=Datura stramonium TaxID=4076 RepID=A0ABS8V0I0_DATST|nr:hypothetical protein [Datura stramonium]
MASFFTDTKKKIQDLFVYIVSCGKSSKELGNDQQGLAQDHGLVIIAANPQGNGPIVPISDEDGGQQDFAIFPPGDERNNLIFEPEDGEKQANNNNNNDNNEQYNEGPVKPDGKAYISTPPDTKKKIQDLFVYIVSCGKSSEDPQGPIEITNVPGRVVILEIPPPGYLQEQEGLFVPEDELQEGLFVPEDELQEGGIHDTIAQTSKAPGKRAPPRFQTG